MCVCVCVWRDSNNDCVKPAVGEVERRSSWHQSVTEGTAMTYDLTGSVECVHTSGDDSCTAGLLHYTSSGMKHYERFYWETNFVFRMEILNTTGELARKQAVCKHAVCV